MADERHPLWEYMKREWGVSKGPLYWVDSDWMLSLQADDIVKPPHGIAVVVFELADGRLTWYPRSNLVMWNGATVQAVYYECDNMLASMTWAAMRYDDAPVVQANTVVHVTGAPMHVNTNGGITITASMEIDRKTGRAVNVGRGMSTTMAMGVRMPLEWHADGFMEQRRVYSRMRKIDSAILLLQRWMRRTAAKRVSDRYLLVCLSASGGPKSSIFSTLPHEMLSRIYLVDCPRSNRTLNVCEYRFRDM